MIRGLDEFWPAAWNGELGWLPIGRLVNFQRMAWKRLEELGVEPKPDG